MRLFNLCLLLFIVAGAGFYLGTLHHKRTCAHKEDTCITNLLATEELLHYRTDELRKLRKKCFAPPPQPKTKEVPHHEPGQATL